MGFSSVSPKAKQSELARSSWDRVFLPFSRPLDTLQGNAEPRKVPLFPMPGEAAEDFAGRLIVKRDPLDRRELEAWGGRRPGYSFRVRHIAKGA